MVARQSKTKKPEKTIEQILFEAIESGKAPNGPLVTSPKIYPLLLPIVEGYLYANQYSETSREAVARLAYHFREEALHRFNHDTVETFALARLLRPRHELTNPGRMDSISHIMHHPDFNQRLDADQKSAAEHIMRVWEAFGKGLAINGRELGGGGSSKQARQPLDSMSDELWEEYKAYFQPWYERVNRIRVNGPSCKLSLSVAGMIFEILVEDVYPESVDAKLGLKKGSAHLILVCALTHYWQPINLPTELPLFLKQPETPSRKPLTPAKAEGVSQ